MSESARFELVEGASFQLPDGSSVTVRDGQLELSDGRRLPMPAAGEAITVERTVTRPDGGTTRIKHTIRLSETQPIVETPARPFPGAGPGSEQEGEEVKKEGEKGETVPAPVVAPVAEAAPAMIDGEKDSNPATPEQPAAVSFDGSQLPEAPSKEPGTTTAAETAEDAPVKPAEQTLMGVNCGRRSLRDMLWGSIPESGLGDDEDEPKAPPKGLLNKSYSIKEEDEGEYEDGDEAHENETHEEPLESSENADDSFEFLEGKGKDTEKGGQKDEQKEPEDKQSGKPEDAGLKPEKESAPENEEERAKLEKEQKLESPIEQVENDSSAKVTFVTLSTSSASEAASEKTDDPFKEPPCSRPNEHSPEEKFEINEETPQDSEPEKPSTEILAEQAAAVMANTASFDLTSDTSADRPEEPHHEKPHLTRQEKLPSSGNLVIQPGEDIVVRVGVPLTDAAPDSKPAEVAPAHVDSNEESTASPSSDGAPSAAPLSDEVTHDLHLKLTPILRSLETDEPKSAAADDVQRAPKPIPSEDRKGTVPPNTPAVVEDRECLSGADEPTIEVEPVSVPKVVSYYESISPRESPAPTRSRDPETSAVPKVIKFAVPMVPEKVYLNGQEPEEMEDTPIPRPVEPPARVELAPEPATIHQQTQVLIPVQGTPDDLDPLSALAASETGTQQPSAPEEKSDDPATPSTTPEKDADAVPDPARDATQESTQAPTDSEKPAPPVYNPELFEHEPKRPLILTSEMVDEDAPPYEAGVHDSRTLPLGRKTAVVTEQPPPFGEEDRSDPRDPFLPDQPRPGAKIQENGFLTTCFDLCCCCWAP